ncbi:MAG: GNAT family N-acetyltransferase, partial [Lachnospiraceae bacterium]|nr:GNAT family N-acetyltransferase [Lachnospiraceae bacterium]
MALSRLQADEVLELFVNNFISADVGTGRKRVFQRFEDAFGNGIVQWHELVVDIMNKKEIESSVLEEFKNLSEKNPRKETPYEYRELREEDFPMVRELLNRAFETILIEKDDKHLKKFINGYSFVACEQENIVGVIMCCPIISLHSDMLYVDSLTVAEHARGVGIWLNENWQEVP